MEQTIKTQIHTYKYDISKDEEAKEYAELKERLYKSRRRFSALCFDFANRLQITPGPIELETKYLFDNQWNTPDKRVFDWYEHIFLNKDIREGHWLEITTEMKRIRLNTQRCGYCGAHYQVQQGYVFCDKCLDSEYLEENNLPLLRLLPVSAKQDRPELTEAELGWLMPLYVERQTTGADSRNANKLKKQRLDIIAELKKTVETAHDKHDGFIWLMDSDVNIDNCIYYEHTNKFSFGWRSPVSASVKSRLLDILVEFPFEYEIKGG